MTSSFKNQDAKWLFSIYAILFILGLFTLSKTGEPNTKYTYIILSSCFTGAAFIVVMDYTYAVFKENTLPSFRATAGWFFSLAMLVWVLRGLGYFILEKEQETFTLLEPMFSTFNSAFLMLGAARIDLKPEEKPRVFGWKIMDWKIFDGKIYFWSIVVFVLAAQLAIAILLWNDSKSFIQTYKTIPDFLYSSITIFFLYVVFDAAFISRRVPIFVILVISSLLLTFVVQLGIAFPVFKSEINVESIGYYYIGSLEIIIFVLLITYYFKENLLKERRQSEVYKQLRRDMNHNIRNAFLDLSLDLKDLSKEKESIDLEEVIFRIKALQELHDRLHNDLSDTNSVNLSDYLNAIAADFKDGYALKEQFEIENNLDHTFRLQLEWARKIGRILIELNINAFHAMKSNSIPISIFNHIYTTQNHLVIQVVDKGPGFQVQGFKENGFGIQNIKDVLVFIGGDAQLTFESPKNEPGTIAQVSIPLSQLN